jgi:hypothetical protein
LVVDALKESQIKGDKLFFADNGIKFRESVLSKIHKEKENDLVSIDLNKVKVIDSSFCREAFVRLISSLSIDEVRPQVLFINVDEYVTQNLEQSFTYHNRFSLVFNKNKKFVIIGKFSDQIADTIKYIIKNKEVKAKEIATNLGAEINTINNRLKSIYEMCIVSRKEIGQESGGKEFIYYLIS